MTISSVFSAPAVRTRSRPYLALAVFLLTLLLTVKADCQDRLILLSPHWEGPRYEFQEGFKEYYRQDCGREAELTWLDVGGTSEILRFVISQFQNSPKGIGVDIVFGGGSDPYLEFSRRGLLEPYLLPSPILDAVPPKAAGVPLYAPDGSWYGAAMTGFGIICNKEVLRRLNLDEPRTWEDLTQPEFRGWIGATDPRKSGSAHKLYEIILQAYGWEKGWTVIGAIGRNVRGFSSGSMSVPKDVAQGELACGLSFDSNAWPQIREAGEKNISFVMPEGLSLIDADGIAILKGAPHGETARKFLQFVMSAAGQRLWLYKPGISGGPKRHELARLPVIPALYNGLREKSDVKINPFAWMPVFSFDGAKAAGRWNILNELLGVFVVDTSSSLPAGAPVSEEAVGRIVASGVWDDPLQRNELERQWKRQSRSSDQLRWYFSFSALPSALLMAGISYVLIKQFVRRLYLIRRRN